MKTKLKLGKRSLAVVLSLFMIFSSLVFTVSADDTDPVGEHVCQTTDLENVSVITDPKCLEPGLGEYVCDICHQPFTQAIPATGHNFVYSQTVAPTCSQQGYDIEVCTGCRTSIMTHFIDPDGHTYSKTAIPATCLEDGGILYTCTVCDETEPGHTKFVSNETALGHNMGEYKIVKGNCDGTFYLKQAACQRDGCGYTAYELDGDQNPVVYYRVQFFNPFKTKTTETEADGTVIPKSYEYELLQTSFVPAGSTATYEGETPARDLTREYGAYTFTGWNADGDLEAVQNNITATAAFQGEETQHWVIFYNPNGSQLGQVQYVNHGEGASDIGFTPTYSQPGYYLYEFKEWNKSFEHVYSNCAVNAVYDRVGKQYKIIYCDIDGTQLDSEVFNYGNAPVNNPTNLYKEPDETYIYAFSGKWNYKYEAPSGESTAWFTENYSIEALRCPEAKCLDCNRSYADVQYNPEVENNEHMTDIEKGIIRVYADYYTRARIYRVRVMAVDSDGDPIRNAGTIQVLNSNGFLYKTATLDDNASAVLELTYDKFYTIQVTYSGEVAQHTITLDERNLGDNYPTIRVMLGSPADVQEDHADHCTCICHTALIGRIYIAILNVIYRLTGRKTVCCYDMYEAHADQLVYTA